jgi:hypothetical protein
MSEIKASQAEQPTISAPAMAADEWHELLPIEKKLIFYSLGLGIVLLVVFIIAFGVFK